MREIAVSRPGIPIQKSMTALRHIAINGSMLDDQPSGVGVYSLHVINNLAELYNGELAERITVFSPTSLYLNNKVRLHKLPDFMQSSKRGKLAAMARFAWNSLFYFSQARKYDVVISPTTHGSFRLRNQVITIHDLISLKYNNISRHQRFYFRYLLPKLIARATMIVTVSETSKRDIIDLLGCDEDKVKVIHNGYDDSIYNTAKPTGNKIRDRFRVSDYILAIGPTYPHKNFERLIDAYFSLGDELTSRHPLLIAGGKPGYLQKLRRHIDGNVLADRIVFAGYIPVELMPALYHEASCLVFPSLYEGFGIPLLEAMGCGCPVLTSNTSSMPEVCGDAALFFNPLQTSEIAGSLTSILTNPTLRNSLREKGLAQSQKFSWKKTAHSLKLTIETNFQNFKTSLQ